MISSRHFYHQNTHTKPESKSTKCSEAGGECLLFSLVLWSPEGIPLGTHNFTSGVYSVSFYFPICLEECQYFMDVPHFSSFLALLLFPRFPAPFPYCLVRSAYCILSFVLRLPISSCFPPFSHYFFSRFFSPRFPD